MRRLVGAELERLHADGITSDELDIAQGYLAGSYEMGLEDSGARMSRLGGQLTILGHLRSVEEQLDRWSNVTLDDVHRVVGRVYGATEPVTVTVGPDLSSGHRRVRGLRSAHGTPAGSRSRPPTDGRRVDPDVVGDAIGRRPVDTLREWRTCDLGGHEVGCRLESGRAGIVVRSMTVSPLASASAASASKSPHDQ